MITLKVADGLSAHKASDAYTRTNYDSAVVGESVVPSSRDTRALWRFHNDLVVVLVGD